jgi:protein-S-isoprenylcysteine O-methyltransferase
LFVNLWILVGSQPAVSHSRLGVSDSAPRDRKTIRLILLSGYASVLVPLGLRIWHLHQGVEEDFSVLRVIGALAGSFGIMFRLWAINILGDFFTAHVMIAENHQLCRRGPYRILRHPSYTGSMLFFLMVPAVLGYAALLPAYLLGWLYVYQRRISAEEEALANHFGAAYEDYRRETKRLIPWIY